MFTCPTPYDFTYSPLHEHTYTMPGSVPDMPGIKAGPDLARFFQNEVATLLNRSNTNFPGAQPVSFGRNHIQELCNEEYV